MAGSVTNQTIKIIVNYMFIHVPKTGGTTFDYMLHKGQLHPLVPCHWSHGTICEQKHCHVQTPAQKQACNTGSSEIKTLNLLDIDPNVQLLTILRDPVDHELSMFAHCQTQGADGQRMHGYPPISFPEYLNFRMAHPENKTFCGYTPFNMQVGKLGGGPDQLEAALHVLKSFFWVGVTGRYEASLCLLRSKLNGRAACSCLKSQQATHITHGTRPDDITMTSMMRRQIHFLAGLDAVHCMLMLCRGCTRIGTIQFELLVAHNATRPDGMTFGWEQPCRGVRYVTCRGQTIVSGALCDLCDPFATTDVRLARDG